MTRQRAGGTGHPRIRHDHVGPVLREIRRRAERQLRGSGRRRGGQGSACHRPVRDFRDLAAHRAEPDLSGGNDAGRRRPAGQPRRAERPHLVLRVGAQRPYRERLVLPVMARRFAALEQTSHSPEPPLQPSAHRPSARHAPGEGTGPPDGHTGCTLDSATNVKPNTPPDRAPAGPARARSGPASGHAHRSLAAICPWIPATQGSIALQGDTRRDREETARIAANSQLAGRFRRMWQVVDSNHRRL